jgi:hypothetical protein
VPPRDQQLRLSDRRRPLPARGRDSKTSYCRQHIGTP